MSNYRQKEILGESWIRAYQITISNHYNSTPSILFSEEELVVLNDHIVRGQLNSSVGEYFRTDNAQTEFEVRNPETGESFNSTATYQDFVVLLYSLYRHLTDIRDGG